MASVSSISHQKVGLAGEVSGQKQPAVQTGTPQTQSTARRCGNTIFPCRIRLRFRIDKPANGAEGEPYHHAAPDQVGENVPESAVERQQRHAERRRKPCPAAAEAALVLSGEHYLQNAQEDEAGHPAEFRHIKDPRRGIEQQQIQRPVERAEGKAAVEAQQQEIRLPAAFAVGDARKHRADERDQQLQQVLNQLHAHPRFPCPVRPRGSSAAAGSTKRSRTRRVKTPKAR